MMKRRITERVLVLILSIAVLLSSTGVYSVFAENYSTTVPSTTSTTVSSSSSETAATVKETQETTTPATENKTEEPEPNVIAEGGAVETEEIKGLGTTEDPYRISSADDLFKMQDIINDSTSSDKYFVLTNDIDLSSVSYAQLKENSVLPGTIVSVDKSKSNAAPNAVTFTLNGGNHKIYGLNVTNTGSAGVAIFGYISAKSTVKYVKFDNLTVNVDCKSAVANSVIALYNNGQFRNCEISNTVLNVNSSANGDATSKIVNKSLKLVESTGIIAINNGTVSNLTVNKTSINVQAEKKNIGVITGINTGKIASVKAAGSVVKTEGCDYVGIAAGKNSGKIESVTATGINASVSKGAAFGGIAGANSGTIVSCVTAGKANGSAYTAGIVGKALTTDEKTKTSNVKNCYSFVRAAANSETGAVIAAGESRYGDNVWSSENSGRVKAYSDGATEGDMVRGTRLVVVEAGTSKNLSKAALGGKYGEMSYALDSTKEIKYEGSGIKYSDNGENIVISAESADKIGKITYTARVAVPAGYEDSTVVSQNYTVVVLTVPEGMKGDGLSEETAVEISNAAELKMISAAPFACFELAKDVKASDNWNKSFTFTGSLNGNNHKITISNEFCYAVFGKITDVNFVLSGKITTAMFGKAVNAEFSNVRLTKGTAAEEGAYVGLSAKNSGTAAFLNKVSGKTVLNKCFTNIPVKVSDSKLKNIAGFIAVLDSEEAVITSCGAVATISGGFEDKIASASAFIAKASKNSKGKITDCYATLYSDIANYALIGGGDNAVKLENAYYSASDKNITAAPKKFTDVKASKWAFEEGEQGFVTGKGGSVSISLPKNIIDDENVSADDFSAMYAAEEISVNLKAMTVENGVAEIPVKVAKEGLTVLNSAFVLIHKGTGLRAEISISNGLDKDEKGNYIINCGSDFMFINDNFERFKDKNFIVSQDIDMSDIKVSTVGGAAGSFTGTLDGCGKTISGLTINSEAKAALFGTLDGATVKNIVFDGAAVKSSGSYAGVLAAQITGGSSISNITFKNSKANAKENYAGILAGQINDSKVSAVKLEKCEVSALNNAGVLTGCAEKSGFGNIIAKDVKASGDNNIGLIGEAKETEIKNVSVNGAEFESRKTVGGIIGSAENTEITSAAVSESKIFASSDAIGAVPSAGGICGTFTGKISDSEVLDSEIMAEGNAAAAGGIAAVTDNAEINKVSVNGGVKVSAPVAGGIVGEAAGKTIIKDSKSSASIYGSEAATKLIVGAGGIIGRVTAEDFGSVTVENANAAGSITAADYAGGIIGSVLSLKAGAVAVKNCVSAAEIEIIASEKETSSGHVIGCIGSLTSEDINKAVSGVVFSSYSSELSAYGDCDAPSTYCDLDKAVRSSFSGIIRNGKEVSADVSNDKAEKLGFVFDAKTGWQSESEIRIQVLDSTEKLVKFKALRTGNVGIVGKYILADDDEIKLNVHFDVKAEISSSLEGEGTKADPYIVRNAFDLETVSEYANENAYFVLENDIFFDDADFDFGGDFYNEGKGFAPAGTKEAPFNGVFEGNGHTISGIVMNGFENAGLFGFVKDAEIKNIIIDNAEVTAEILAAVIAADVQDSEISNISIKNSAITAKSAQSSAAAVAAFAENTVIENVEVNSSEITACKAETMSNTASAAAICARALNVSISNTSADADCKVYSDGAASGFAGYCDNVKISNSEVYAQVEGVIASAAAADVAGTLEIKNSVAGGSVSGTDFAGGIAAKAIAPVKANNVAVSAKISGEGKSAIIAAYADEKVFNDSEKSDVELKDVVYSSYQNSAEPFASAKINAYQSAGYLNGISDVNSLTVENGEALVVGKNAVRLSDAIEFGYNMSKFEIEDVYSNPENLVRYNNGAVAAEGTATENAVLVIKYTNGLETAIPLVCIEGMTGEGTNASPYIIDSEDTLKLLKIYPNGVFRMAKDIALSDEWTPVENFSGKLDGAGFTISGLNVNADEAGLFETLSGNAVVKNVNFTDAVVEGKTSAGIVAANVIGNAQITGISITSSNVKADDNAAAVAGNIQAENAKIADCNVTGSSVTGKNAAGIAALVEGNAVIKSCRVDACEIKGIETAGGITAIADADEFIIENSEASADVSADTAGAVVGSSEKSVSVVNVNAGGTVSGKYAEGGIIGLADGNVSIKNSKALAELSENAKHTAALVAKFAERPEDNEEFGKSFSGNTISGKYDEFEPAVMQYQNYVPAVKAEVRITLKGSGTEKDPYIVSSASDLAQIPDSSTAYFVLNSDISISDKDYGISIDENGETVYGVFCEGYKPVKDFAGTFDGKGHIIKGLYIDSDSDYVGLFANITANGSVKNLHIELLEEDAGYGYYGISGNNYVGGIAGYCDSVNGIDNCSVCGSSISGSHAVGGLVGGLASSEIRNSFAMTEIIAQNKAGGLAGITSGDSSIKNSFAACVVNAAGGTIAGTNNGTLILADVMVNGSSHGTGAIAVSENNGTIKAMNVLIAGSNDDEKKVILDAEKAVNVYSDRTTLGTSAKNITSMSTSELTASKPEGLENWQQNEGRYPVPVMADSYSNKKAAAAAIPGGTVIDESTIGNVKVNYKLVNTTGEKVMDSELTGILIKSKVDGKTITSDFFTSCSGEKKSINKILVTSGGFYVDSSLPVGYKFVVTAKDSSGRTVSVSDAGSLGAYVESGAEKEVNLVISIVREENPWGIYSLWESLAR